MKKRRVKFLLIFIFPILVASLCLAQTQTGSVAGKVTDNEQEPLPGATVTLSGPALMGTQTYTTTEGGDFRFPAVPPGSNYVITVEMPGFQKVVRGELIVSVGKTFRLDIILQPTTLQEEITVTGAAPVVDVTSSKQSITYSGELVTNIPLDRDYRQILNSMPGVIDQPYRGQVGENPSVLGAAGRQNLYAVDGVNVTDRTMGNQETNFSFDVLDEVEVEVGGKPAEVGLAEGAFVNVVTKSGGNKFEGTAIVYFFNQDMSRNLIPETEAKAVNLRKAQGLKSLFDVSASVGGPLIKDKLWFFLNGRYNKDVDVNETIVDGVYDIPWDMQFVFTKLTFMARQNLKITAMGSFNNQNRDIARGNEVGYYRNKYSGYYIHGAKNWIATAIANWIMNQNTFLDFRFQFTGIIRPRYPHPDGPSGDTPFYTDRILGTTIGPARYSDDFDRWGYGVTLSFNRFVDNVLGGNHEFKAGFEWEYTHIINPNWREGSIGTIYTYNGSIWGYQDVQPYMGRFSAYAIGGKREDWYFLCYTRRWGLYAQDSFTIKNRLTLNIGLRYNDNPAGYYGTTLRVNQDPLLVYLAPDVFFKEYDLPDYKDIIKWRSIEPRLGLVYDLFGDKTTSLKASFCQYYDYLVMEYFISFTPVHPFARGYSAYWFDLNQNGVMETTDRYQLISAPPAMATFDPYEQVDPDLKPGYVNEFIVGLERELFKDFSLSISYIHKDKRRQHENIEKYRGYTVDSGWWVPYTVKEPGADGKFGNADDQEITVYGVKKGAPISRTYVTNPPGIKRIYNALVIVANKRMSNGWQLQGNLVLSKNEGNTGVVFRDSGTSSAFNTPNWLINRYGRLSDDRPLMIKIQSTAQIPLGFMVSGYYSYYSGAPWARTLSIQLPNDSKTYEYPGTFADTVLGEAPGTRRYKATSNLDLRVEKYFKVADFGRLGFFVDILNAFGESGYNIDQDPGGRVYNNGTFVRNTTYGRFTGVYGLRTYKLSARFTF